MGKIDCTLECIRLEWCLSKKETGILSSAQDFSLAPSDAMRGAVHIVQRSTMIEQIEEEDSRALKYFKRCNGVEGWENDLLYVKSIFQFC